MASASRALRRFASLASAGALGAAPLVVSGAPARGPVPIACEDGTTVTPWAPPTRAQQLARLAGEEFDLVVIGGGCVGAGVAWEASTRGLKVALVERDDYSSGTSGRSTKLIHGGIRYLEAAFKRLDYSQLALVQEALEERAHLLNAAPYMAHPLATLIPLYTWWEIPYMWVGAKLYDFMAGSDRFVPEAYYISREEAVHQFPMLKREGLRGGIVYYDGQHNDSRMNVMVALTAAQEGAATANYVAVEGVLKDSDGRARGVAVRDRETGTTFHIRAKGVVNATGAFGDAIRLMDDPSATPLIQGASGVHLVLADHFSPDNMGLIVPKTKDGRVLFFLPWEGSTICGTTDAPAPVSMTPRATEEEVAFILEGCNAYLSRKITRKDVKAAWTGIRPLIKDPTKLASGTSALTRSHLVEVSRTGLVSILGGKWTTYRRMAQDAVDAAAKAIPNLPPVGPSVTQHRQLLGADRAGIVFNRRYHRIPVTLREVYGLERDIAKHLSSNYGTRALQVAELVRATPTLGARLSPRYAFIKAEVVFAVQQEYALTVNDVLARRTRLAFLSAPEALAAIPAVIELMAPLLGWSSARKAKEAADAEVYVREAMLPIATPEPVLHVAGVGASGS